MVKAAVLVGPQKIEVREFPDPEPDDYSIIARPDVCGICGTDLHLFEGDMKIPYPMILGHEFTAVVEKVGLKAKGLEATGGEIHAGDLVAVVPGTSKFCGTCFYCRYVPDKPQLCSNRRAFGISMSCADAPHLFGAFAEGIYIDVSRWYVFKLDQGFPRELGALVEPMAVASRAFERSFSPGRPSGWDGFGPGKTILVQGAGPIGLLVMAAARIAGAGKILAIEKVKTRSKMAEVMGADRVIDMNEFPTREERTKEVLRITNGIGVDVAVECVGFPDAFGEGIGMVRRGGRYVEVGHYTDQGTVEVSPHAICRGDIEISGSWSYPPTQFQTSINLLSKYRDTIPYKSMLTHTFHFSEASKAIETIRSGQAVKVTLTP
jgi:threonine dehydrogenase-like Zn-dependent dehydrogenase